MNSLGDHISQVTYIKTISISPVQQILAAFSKLKLSNWDLLDSVSARSIQPVHHTCHVQPLVLYEVHGGRIQTVDFTSTYDSA